MAAQQERVMETATEYLVADAKLPCGRIIPFVISGLAVLVSLIVLYTITFTQIHPYAQRYVILAIALILAFLTHPLGGRSWRAKPSRLFTIDLLLILVTLGTCIWVMWDIDAFVIRTSSSAPGDMVAGTVFIVLVLEATRRLIGWALVILCLVFIAQLLFGQYFPDPFRAASVNWSTVVEILYMQMFGIFSLPMQAITSYVLIYLILAAFLVSSGAGDFIIRVANSLTGRYSGGPAKVAVVASSFFGTISGSVPANVVGTGCWTIPMMKKLGFQPHFAGAVEAVASTGGQIMPPILGVTAFLISEYLGVSYWRVVLASIAPALLYYLAVFLMVHFRAAKLGLVGLPKEEVPRIRPEIADGWPFIVPILLLFFLLMSGFSVATTGLYALIGFFVVAMLKRRTRVRPTTLLISLEKGGMLAVSLCVICGAAGIIVGTFYISGIGDTLSSIIVDASGGHMWLGLIIAAVVCLVFGLAVPTPVVYLMVLLVGIPALIDLGVVPIAAHMFAFYWGIIANITPPVAIGAFVAASIAGSGMMRTAFEAFKLGGASYLIPFVFVFAPALLMEGPITETFVYFIFAGIGVGFLAVGIEGWLFQRVNPLARLLFLAGAVAIALPFLLSEVIGAAILLPTFFLQLRGRLRRAPMGKEDFSLEAK